MRNLIEDCQQRVFQMKQMNKYKNWLLGEPEKDKGDEKAKHKIGYMLQKKCVLV